MLSDNWSLTPVSSSQPDKQSREEGASSEAGQQMTGLCSGLLLEFSSHAADAGLLQCPEGLRGKTMYSVKRARLHKLLCASGVGWRGQKGSWHERCWHWLSLHAHPTG